MKFITQAAMALQEQKKSKRRLAVFMCLAVVVVLGTFAALKLHGQAMSHKEKRLICTAKAHQHKEDCYDADGRLICGQADYLIHTHNDDCYDGDGKLACHLPEIEAHTHTDACYTEEEVLVCTKQEQAHQHTDVCYTPQRGDLQCQIEEHIHDDACYDSATGELVCQMEEHQHGDNCYKWENVLTCAYAAESHQHESGCYTQEQGALTCEEEEHQHDDSCFGEDGALVCEKEEHQHDDSCYEWNQVLTCQLEETPEEHIHTEACYEKKETPTCGQLELHTHTEDCYGENGALTCGLLELKEHLHQEECFEIVELTDEEVAVKLEQEKMEEAFQSREPGDETTDVSGNDDETGGISGDSVSSDGIGSVSGGGILGDETGSISGDDMGSVSGDSISGSSVSENDAHIHDEDCYDAAGGLMCGYENVKEPEIIKTYTDDAYIVTARYTKRANIPEKAELRAELITAESGGEHYVEREAEIKRALEDDSVSMNALFKIGFYVDEEEVEPQDNVVITVQFLDEDGMEDGSPIAVIHFAEGGSEIINGGKAKDRSTTFKTRSFSEFGIVEGYEVSENDQRDEKDDGKPKEEKMVQISETCGYSNDMFRALFRIKGEVKLPVDVARAVEAAAQVKDDQKEQVGENVQSDTVADTEDEKVREESKIPDSSETESEEDLVTTARGGGVSGNAVEKETDTPDIAVNDAEERGEVISGNTAENGQTDNSADVPGTEETSAGSGLEFRVEAVDKDAEKFAEDYAAVITCMDEASEEKDRLMLQVMAYSLTCGGEPLDISDCEVSVEVTPSQSLKKTAHVADNEKTDDGDEQEEVTLSVIQTIVNEDAEAAEALGEKVGRIVSAEPVSEMNSPLAAKLDTVGTQGIAACSVTSQANPGFTVEFYANINTFATSVPGKTPINVIDTSGDGTGDGKGVRMPVNGGKMSKKAIYLNDDHRIAKTETLTEIYSSEKYEYISAPGLVYFNKLAKNKNYILKKIEVKRKGSNSWETYDCGNGKEWHFTNKKKTQDEYKDKFILITEDATIRLVHSVKVDSKTNGAFFYDYDVSDGKIYKNAVDDVTKVGADGLYFRGTATTNNTNDLWYMYTKKQGINGNLPNQTFGFGNTENQIKTGLGHIEGNGGNPTNQQYGRATFGLVTQLENGKIKYAKNVVAPNLFNEGSANGKTSYAGNLVFRQEGDTFTLTDAMVEEDGAVVSKKNNIDVFNREMDNWDKSNHFAGNDFYPLDDVSSAGTNGHDLKFGASGSLTKISSFSDRKTVQNVPASDDGKDHNHYFGMYYTFEFDLVEDYVGPLEYLFYGDDDMWVFLEGGEYTGKLICDLGGVHSTYGEYVNLWDYIKKGSSGHYKLSFFYTERGASGSTCWMQFTLPSVSFDTTEQDTGKLQIEKKLTGIADDDQEFGFEIKFKDKEGHDLMNDYSYTKYQKATSEPKPATDTVVDNDILIWNNAKFTLKANEYIVIRFLPEDSKYTITEVGPVTLPSGKEPGSDIIWTVSGDNPYKPEITGGNPTETEGVITGSIKKNNIIEITYNNVQKYELPETGGAGAGMYLMIGVFCIMAGTVLIYRKKIVAKRV